MMKTLCSQTTHSCQAMAIALLALILSFLPITVNALPTLAIPSYPLVLTIAEHPQVLFAIGNSQSMDGTLSGAIMVGSGSVPNGSGALLNSSSPLNYNTIAGFTPPLQAADGSGNIPYTVTISSTKYDNGPSRLNVAKAGVKAIIQAYMPNTDFALAVYSTSGLSLYTTWVYYMSPQTSDFSFTNTPITGSRYVKNPCYGYLNAGFSTSSATIYNQCVTLANRYTSTTLNTNQYMLIGASSDDPQINDVLYAGSQPQVFITYNGPSPATPYPPNFYLANYKNGSVLLSYSTTLPSIGGFATGPTNAGYVPYSPVVMYAYRGFGYYGSQSANSGNVIVPIKTAGTNPTTSSVATAIASFTPYLNPETNNVSTTEIKASAVQSSLAGLLTTAKTYLNSLPRATCPAKQYVILITDGLPTKDLSANSWPPLGSAAGNGYSISATFTGSGALNTTNAQALTDTITAISNLATSSIKTYVIGLGAGVQASVNPQANATLTAMAVAGNTINFYPATDPATLVSNLAAILISLQDESFDTTAAAVSSSFLQAGSYEYQTSFNGNTTPYQDWTGNLTSIALSATTGAPIGGAIWTAQSLLDTQTTRLIATWNSTSNAGVPFQWANISTAQQAQLQPTDSLGASRLSYIRGVTSLEKRNGGTFRNRSHILGDITDSLPAYVGTPSNPGLTISSTSYAAFAISKANRQAMIYVGANDGMLHAFNASTGAEVFSFIPNSVFSNLYKLSTELYNQNHQFYVDGSPQAGDVQFSNSTWHTLLIGGENSGGQSIYALDITNPTAITSENLLASNVLWEYTDADLGYTFGQPQIGQISTSNTTALNFAVFFGNGYNSPNNNAVLYAVNPQTGQTIAKINLCNAIPGTCNASNPQGLSTVALAHSDGLLGQPITQVYAGDLQGNLWAIDVSNTNAGNWTTRLLFQAKDSTGSPQPITTPPLVTLNPSYPRLPGLFIMFGTGQFLTTNDLTNTQTQTIYGVWDNPSRLGTTLTRSNLQQQTLTLVSATTSGLPQDIITSTSLAVNWGTNYGWFSDLPIAGLRVNTVPILINGAFITTLNKPPSSPCGTASSMFLDLNYLTGGAFPSPQLSLNRSGIINNNSRYNGLNPVGLSISSSYASAPVNIGVNASSNVTQLITLATGVQITVPEPYTMKRQAAWWQIQ